MTKGGDPLRIVFRCDASVTIGGGHVMRCLTLANAVSEAGAKVTFIAAAMPEAMERRIVDAGHRFESIPASREMQRDGADWEAQPYSVEAQLADAKSTGAAAGPSDWLIVDHYLLDASWHAEARSFSRKLLVIDDLANRSYDCDILLDQTFGRSVEDYLDRVPSGARILTGATYALLRPEFARERPTALVRRQASGPVRRILVSMGTADPGGLTAHIVEQVCAAAPEGTIDVVLGPQATSLDHVRGLAAGNSRVCVHVNSERMAELMRDADVAIGAAGTTSWERCCLGLPAITLVVAGNQRLVAANLENAGAVILAESPGAIACILQRLASDERARFGMIAAAAAITDGTGAKLVADAMFGAMPRTEQQLTLRPARLEDSCTIWLWRNDYITRTMSQTTDPIAWTDHAAWWQRTIKSPDRRPQIAEIAGVPVAALRFDQIEEGDVEVSINLAPSARGLGLGGRILAEACKAFEERAPASLTATIHTENAASRRIFEKTGFVRVDGLSNSAFERYVLLKGTTK